MRSRLIPIPMLPLVGIPVLHRAQEALVERHRLGITGRRERGLGLETLRLHDRVEQAGLGAHVGKADHGLQFGPDTNIRSRLCWLVSSSELGAGVPSDDIGSTPTGCFRSAVTFLVAATDLAGDQLTLRS